MGAQYHRHAVVDLVHINTRRRGDDGARRHGFGVGVVGVAPVFVEPGEEQGIIVGAREEVGLALTSGAMVPLVKTVDGNHAGAFRERATKRGFLGDGLAARVKEFVADLGVLRPTRHESPAVAIEYALRVVLAHAKETTLGSDVPTGVSVGIESRGEGRVEESGQASWWAEEGDATTHGL